MSGPSVAAVVLTFDAPLSLSRCLQALREQEEPPAEIIVIDNAGSPPAAWTVGDADAVSVLRLPENLGPAGGYAEGLRRFLASGRDVAWVMDDDCAPEPTCLSRLLEGTPDGIVGFPTEIDARGVETNHPAWAGVLLPRSVIEDVGLPRAELFWWIEDTEYLQWRIPRAGHEVVRVPEARVVHHRDPRARKPSWKYYYEVRNTVDYRLRVKRYHAIRKLVARLPRVLARILIREDDRARKVQMFVRGLRDGLAGRLGKTVDPLARSSRAPAGIREGGLA